VKVKQRDHKKLEDVTCDVCKTVKQKPNQVKLKVGGGGGGERGGLEEKKKRGGKILNLGI